MAFVEPITLSLRGVQLVRRGEWPEARAQLLYPLDKPRGQA